MQPEFWKKHGILSLVLTPLSLIYSIAGLLRPLINAKYQANIPVICIGNVTVGGAGKTPIVLAITELLRKNGMNVAIASRGYKGDIKKPTLVDKNKHTVNSVGDEPLILARIAPTYISKKRHLAISMAKESGADIVIMDDGMQNPTVKKDLTILVIDGKYGIGNGLVMPAGPLREALLFGLRKSDIVILLGKDEMGILNHPAIKSMQRENVKPIIRARLDPCGNIPDKTQPYIAFAGIGNPDKFFSTLVENGYNLVGEIAFPDHYNYNDDDINNLIKKAEKIGAVLITTQKDEVRLPLFARKKISVLCVEITWENEAQIKNILDNMIQK
jgi:tetraacyldisaccharide 4'-kinase